MPGGRRGQASAAPNSTRPRHTPDPDLGLRALDGGPSSCVHEGAYELVLLVDCEARVVSVLVDQVVSVRRAELAVSHGEGLGRGLAFCSIHTYPRCYLADPKSCR